MDYIQKESWLSRRPPPTFSKSKAVIVHPSPLLLLEVF